MGLKQAKVKRDGLPQPACLTAKPGAPLGAETPCPGSWELPSRVPRGTPLAGAALHCADSLSPPFPASELVMPSNLRRLLGVGVGPKEHPARLGRSWDGAGLREHRKGEAGGQPSVTPAGQTMHTVCAALTRMSKRQGATMGVNNGPSCQTWCPDQRGKGRGGEESLYPEVRLALGGETGRDHFLPQLCNPTPGTKGFSGRGPGCPGQTWAPWHPASKSSDFGGHSLVIALRHQGTDGCLVAS